MDCGRTDSDWQYFLHRSLAHYFFVYEQYDTDQTDQWIFIKQMTESDKGRSFRISMNKKTLYKSIPVIQA